MYRYTVTLTHTYKTFDVIVPYEYPNEGVDILTAQYGGPSNCKVEYRGRA